MYFLYSILLSVALLLYLPVFFIRRERYLEGIGERLGRYASPESASRPVIWIHCVSVGEANAAVPIVTALKSERPDVSLVISVTTRTGRSVAEKNFGGLADAIFYFPLDLGFAVRRAIKAFRPSLILLIETEIWPRFIREAASRNIPVVMVNGRISERSFRNYQRIRPLIRRILAQFSLFLMQSEADADRIKRLGATPEKVLVTGNLKFDRSAIAEKVNDGTAEKTGAGQVFDRDDWRPLIVAASTHEPEEQIVLEAFRILIKELPSAPKRPRLLIAPRHPERFDRVRDLINGFAASENLLAASRSRSGENEIIGADLILLDTIGELAGIYTYAFAVFVGGSLIRHGGQSVYEPAAAGCPIIVGPFTSNFSPAVEEMSAAGAIFRLEAAASDPRAAGELANYLSRLLSNPGNASEMGRRARRYFEERSGKATAKTLALIKPFLPEISG